jgi:hypothetical protein
MKIAVILLVSTAISGINAFVFVSNAHQSRRASSSGGNSNSNSNTAIYIGRESNIDLSGNAWKPDSEKMGVSRC